jgi:hypothetical protein
VVGGITLVVAERKVVGQRNYRELSSLPCPFAHVATTWKMILGVLTAGDSLDLTIQLSSSNHSGWMKAQVGG